MFREEEQRQKQQQQQHKRKRKRKGEGKQSVDERRQRDQNAVKTWFKNGLKNKTTNASTKKQKKQLRRGQKCTRNMLTAQFFFSNLGVGFRDHPGPATRG